jgi:hypothetical protein
MMINYKMKTRALSDAAYPFRKKSRFEFIDGSWYFSAREGLKGPYLLREEAETEAMLFVRGKEHTDNFGLIKEHYYSVAV